MEKKNIYLKKILSCIPRILSLENRDPYSPAYGSFDRIYWGWKFRDFPDATLQRAVYPLSILYNTQCQNNFCFKNNSIEQWIKAGLFYCHYIQHKNGSFDQAYPNEYSYAATAFILHTMLQTIALMHENFTEIEKKLLFTTCKKAAQFLTEHSEVHGFISNHLSATAYALYRAGNLFHETTFVQKAQETLHIILSKQSQEGWFIEYEGPDPGYETLGIYYLAKYYQETKHGTLLNALKKSIEFLSYSVHPDGTFGGIYGTRNTEIFYPAGLELLKTEIPLAGKICENMLPSIKKNYTVTPHTVDTENLIPLLENYSEAYLFSSQYMKDKYSHDIQLPSEKAAIAVYFHHAKWFIKGNKNFYFICNAAKGGVIKIYNKEKKKLERDDGGYIGRIKRKNILLTTQIINPSTHVTYKENELIINTPFMRAPQKMPTPLTFILLRLINCTISKNITLGNLFKKLVIMLLVTRKQSFPATLTRCIKITKEKISIEDTITKQSSLQFQWLVGGFPFYPIHMGSSHYFQKHDSNSQKNVSALAVNDLNKTHTIHTSYSIY